jgi:uncharacterized protein (TIGR02757 family)
MTMARGGPPGQFVVTRHPSLTRARRGFFLRNVGGNRPPVAHRVPTLIADELRGALNEIVARTDHRARRERDPVRAVHRFSSLADRELVGLLAASIAFGNVTAILAKLDDALLRMGPSPAEAADDAAGLRERMRGWVHRVYCGEDVAALLSGARRVQWEAGSLGERFAAEMAAHGALRPALAAWVRAIREAGAMDSLGRGAKHLLPDPFGASGCKRLLLFLRWMVRPADGVDLGLWSAWVSPAALLIPVDVHVHRLASNMALTDRPTASWAAAEQITARLAELDRADPVRYDFALCHLGMVQRCPSQQDAARCEGCGVKPLCRHWRLPSGAKNRDKRAPGVRS